MDGVQFEDEKKFNTSINQYIATKEQKGQGFTQWLVESRIFSDARTAERWLIIISFIAIVLALYVFYATMHRAEFTYEDIINSVPAPQNM